MHAYNAHIWTLDTSMKLGFLGFGEAAQAFVTGWRHAGLDLELCAYDILFDNDNESIRSRCRDLDVTTCNSPRQVGEGATFVISAVTADQVMTAAQSIGKLSEETLYLDINSAAPQKKQAAAAVVGSAYVDLAVLAPVHPKLHATRILMAGPTRDHLETLATVFPAAEAFSDSIGDASRLKMIRSIFVKGVEAVALECSLAAFHSGLDTDIFPSLNNVLEHADARSLADYMTERVATHGLRRAAEMDEVCDTLSHMGLPNAMSRAAAETQRLAGAFRLTEDLPGSDGKLSNNAEEISREVLKRIVGSR